MALAVTVSGCAGSPPGADTAPTAGSSGSSAPRTPSSTATPVVSATPTPTPAAAAPATPTAPPVAASAACDSALSAAEYDQLAADGLLFRDDTPHDNLDAMMADGGIRCLWRVPNTDVEAWYAQWPSDQATWDALTARLLSGGATAATEAVDGYDGVAQFDYNAALTYREGTVYYASPPRLFDSVLALQ
jgi:hypothetical protein